MLPPSIHDPFFQLNWRWLRATFLAEQAEPGRHPQDDSWVRRAAAFAAARGRRRDDPSHQCLAGAIPEAYQDHVLFNSASVGAAEDAPVARLLEDRLGGPGTSGPRQGGGDALGPTARAFQPAAGARARPARVAV